MTIPDRDVRVGFKILSSRTGEAFQLEIRLTALRDLVPVLKGERLHAYGALQVEVRGPDGERIPGGPPKIVPPAALVVDDVVRLEQGKTEVFQVSLMVTPSKPGRHRLTVWYRPLWIFGDTLQWEAEVDVAK